VTASGWQNQQTGDAGQSLVQAELTTHGFLIGPLQPDPGEDFWVEESGRRAVSEGRFPLRALLQVKGTPRPDEAVFVDDIPRKQIVRWASQPLPVFLVGVRTSAPHAFYAKAIDDVVADDLQGKDPTALESKTVRVKLPPVADLAACLSKAIEDHHRSMRLVLDGLSETEIEQHYFEVLDKRKPSWRLLPAASWRVLWKSSPRPQHFAAMLTELARRAEAEYATTLPCPAYVVFHVYRSLFDEQRNLAIARADWVYPGHPRAAETAEKFGAVGGFRIRQDHDVDAYREFFRARTATDDEFAHYAREVGTLLDEVIDAVLAGPGGAEVWTDALRAQFQVVDSLWNEGPMAPVKHKALDDALTALHGAVFDHEFVAVYRKDKLTADIVAKLLREAETKMGEFRGSWRVLIRARL
jgi:hypothetical protein